MVTVKDKVWDKAKTIPGKDPKKYRKDPTQKVIYYGSYGKLSALGWEQDHIKPKSRGGSNSIKNLQALNTKTKS